MKKLSAFLTRIPRPARTIIQITIILLCLAIILIVSDIPSYTAEMEYRRTEKEHMIGPATILGTEKPLHRNLLIAKSDTELILYHYKQADDGTFYYTDLVCREKHGDLTILAAGGTYPNYSHRADFTLPLILFDEYPEAVRAEVEFYLFFGEYSDPYHTVPYEKYFSLTADRINEGYFYFPIEYKAYTNIQYSSMLETLAAISSGSSWSPYDPVPIPVTVRLYNEAGEMIVNEIIYFRTPEDDLVRP